MATILLQPAVLDVARSPMMTQLENPNSPYWARGGGLYICCYFSVLRSGTRKRKLLVNYVISSQLRRTHSSVYAW